MPPWRSRIVVVVVLWVDPVASEVSPHSSHGTMWWTPHQDGDRSQPGCAHPRSRAVTARRTPSGTVRVTRPMSRGRPAPFSTIGTTAASQASIRRLCGVHRPPKSSTAARARRCRSSSPIRTEMTGRRPPVSGSPPCSRVVAQRPPEPVRCGVTFRVLRCGGAASSGAGPSASGASISRVAQVCSSAGLNTHACSAISTSAPASRSASTRRAAWEPSTVAITCTCRNPIRPSAKAPSRSKDATVDTVTRSSRRTAPSHTVSTDSRSSAVAPGPAAPSNAATGSTSRRRAAASRSVDIQRT